MTNVLKTGRYSCDLKSYGEPFQAVWKKQKQESSTASLSVALQPLLDAHSCFGVCSLRKDAGELEDIRAWQL